MIYVTSEAQRRAFKKWREKNKEKIKEYAKKKYLKNREQIRKQAREYARTKNAAKLEKILLLFPRKCSVCGVENNVVRYHLHKIDGVEHQTRDTYEMALKNPSDFIRVCYACHVRIHWWMKHIQFLKELEPFILWENPLFKIYHNVSTSDTL